MQIWVDADGCPAVIRDILFRAARRVPVQVTLVANRPLAVPSSPWIRTLQVGAGFDVADAAITRQAGPGDLVITADIPLAAAVVERGALALSPRGELFSAANIGERLSLRNFTSGLRDAGIATGGPPPLSQGDRHAFAHALDRHLAHAPR